MRHTLFLGLVLVGLSACRGERSTSGDTADARASAAPREVRFTAKDFAFEGPDTIEAGIVTLSLANEGTMLHHLQLVALPNGVSVVDFQRELAGMQGGPLRAPQLVETGGVSAPPPGEPARVTMLVEPGQYAVVCFINIPDHVPHVMKGMIKALNVTPSASTPATLPQSDLSLTLVDYAFSFSAPPTSGSHVIRVENAAGQKHEFVLFRLLPGKSVDDVMSWATTYDGPAPVTSVGGVPAIEPGQVADVYVTLTPGQYLALCFVPDSKDGQPHVAHGMILPFQVS